MLSTVLLLIALTCLFELPIWYWGLHPAPRSFQLKPFGSFLLFVLLLNAFTNPLANLAIRDLQLNWWLIEGGVVLIEFGMAWIFWRMHAGRMFLTSLLANAFSAGPGTWFYLWLFA